MPILEFWLLAVTISAVLLGGLSVVWARGEEARRRTRWGRRLFVGTLLALGGLGLIAAVARSHGLPPLGLVAGFLVIAMLWESPQPGLERGGK